MRQRHICYRSQATSHRRRQCILTLKEYFLKRPWRWRRHKKYIQTSATQEWLTTPNTAQDMCGVAATRVLCRPTLDDTSSGTPGSILPSRLPLPRHRFQTSFNVASSSAAPTCRRVFTIGQEQHRSLVVGIISCSDFLLLLS